MLRLEEEPVLEGGLLLRKVGILSMDGTNASPETPGVQVLGNLELGLLL